MSEQRIGNIGWPEASIQRLDADGSNQGMFASDRCNPTALAFHPTTRHLHPKSMSTMLTLGAAARHCGVSKGTISKAIASGKLSATRRENGSWAIDGAAELARYVEVNGHRFRSETV